MLSKKHRLPIQEFFKNGRAKIIRGKYFIIKTRLSNLPFSRFGAIVSAAKVSKSAVKRNKIKRTFFNFIRLNKHHLKPGKDTLIIFSPLVSKLVKKEIENELEKLL